jgi:hypothetical protein
MIAALYSADEENCITIDGLGVEGSGESSSYTLQSNENTIKKTFQKLSQFKFLFK